MLVEIILTVIGLMVLIFLGVMIFISKAHQKVPQGRAIVRTGFGGVEVTFDKGIFVIPLLHQAEEMDISLKTIEVSRFGKEGLVCKDNLRADIKVVFFVRVNKDRESIIQVAQTIGCARASDQSTLNNLFEAKFSEALKTVGKNFEFESLYTARDQFKADILKNIGNELNGYELDDCAIDYLEQTALEALNEDNILDAEGITKITKLTATQKEHTNERKNALKQRLTEQNVKTQENILQLELTRERLEERNRTQIAEMRAEQKEIVESKTTETELRIKLLKEQAAQDSGVAEFNREREVGAAEYGKEQVLVAEKQKVLTTEQLQIEERERVVGEARIEKEKALEIKKREIQTNIKERKAEERKTVEEEQRIEDTIQIAEAERLKKVQIIAAQQDAESIMIKQMRQAEADKLAAEVNAQQLLVEADAKKNAAVKDAEARKVTAEALAAEEATVGLAEAEVTRAKAEAFEVEGAAKAHVLEKTAAAEAKSIELKADAERKKGLAEAEVSREKGSADASVLEQKAAAEATGIAKKAEAMKLLDGVGREHEEFKLRLEAQRQIQMAEIEAQRAVAQAQAQMLAESMRNAKIDIVGGETEFFNSMLNAVNKGKSIDRMVNSSQNLLDVKSALLGSGDEGGDFIDRLKTFTDSYGIDSNTIRNLSLSALITRLMGQAQGNDKSVLSELLDTVTKLGMSQRNASDLIR